MAAARAASGVTKAFRGLVVDCEDLPKWDGSEHLFVDRFRKPGDEWTVRRVAKGEDLTDDDATQSDAIVITGSHYSPYDELAWISSVSDWLRGVMSLPNGPTAPRIFAACFGHQLLARAMGGEVGRNKDGKFWFRVADIHPQGTALAQMPWSKGLVEPVLTEGDGFERLALRMGGFSPSVGPLTGAFADKEHQDIAARPALAHSREIPAAGGVMLPVHLIKSHGDAVLSPPRGALVLASSPGVDHEMLLLPSVPEDGDAELPGATEATDWSRYRAFTVQGHAEFTPREIEAKILPALATMMGEEEVAAFHATKHKACHDWAILEIAQRFLRKQDE